MHLLLVFEDVGAALKILFESVIRELWNPADSITSIEAYVTADHRYVTALSL